MIPPILITGAARSGTSMTAGVIHICGAFGGNTSGPNQYNQKGMFENVEIRNNMSKPYLTSLGCDPLGQKPLPNTRQVFEATEDEARQWRARVEQVMCQQGYKDGPWYYKGAKMCLVWYLWHLAFPDAKWIIVRRDKHDIVRSCLRTAFMRKYHDAVGWHKWVEVHERRFQQMIHTGLDVMEVWPKKAIEGDMDEFKRMAEWLGLTWQQKQVEAFIDPALYGRK